MQLPVVGAVKLGIIFGVSPSVSRFTIGDVNTGGLDDAVAMVICRTAHRGSTAAWESVHLKLTTAQANLRITHWQAPCCSWVHRFQSPAQNVSLRLSTRLEAGYLSVSCEKECTLIVICLPDLPSSQQVTSYRSQEPRLEPTGPSCVCLLYTSPSPRDATLSRMPSSA